MISSRLLNDDSVGQIGTWVHCDIILKVGGKQADNPQQIIEMISGLTPGASEEILLLRGWEQITLDATIAERPQFMQ